MADVSCSIQRQSLSSFKDLKETSPLSKKSPTRIKSRHLQLFSTERLWSRIVLIVCVTAVLYMSGKKRKEYIFASKDDIFEKRTQDVSCSESYKFKLEKFKGCTPDHCGRMISDTLIDKKEVDTLLKVAIMLFAVGDSQNEASILDLHSGAFSQNRDFVNFYNLPDSWNVLKPEDLFTYKIVNTKIRQEIAQYYKIRLKSLHLTYPTFFSRLTNLLPSALYDEYRHGRMNKEITGSSHYTSLLYLSDYNRDFKGGRLVFMNMDNTSSIVEPKKGRLLIFTSGKENAHFVEQVLSGTRYAITISFTCNPFKAIPDPNPEPY